MNELLRPPSLPGTTQAAEGLQRRRFSVAEIESMVASGIIAEDERIELIGGEVVPMSPKGRRHEVLRSELAFMLSRQCPAHLKVATATPLNLAADCAPQPDIIVFPASLKAPDVDGKSALLVIEIADTSLAYDLATKPAIYASHNVREYWVINANTLETTTHREPSGSAYRVAPTVGAEQLLLPRAAPELGVRLADLDLG
jgi:Uma2 family endonuclease